jgi:hypothetical protein
MAESLRDAVPRMLQRPPGARLACLHGQETSLIGHDEDTDKAGHNRHALAIAALKYGAQPLGLPEESTTLQMPEAVGVASAVLGYAAETLVCSFSVVRPRRGDEVPDCGEISLCLIESASPLRASQGVLR